MNCKNKQEKKDKNWTLLLFLEECLTKPNVQPLNKMVMSCLICFPLNKKAKWKSTKNGNSSGVVETEVYSNKHEDYTL